MLANIRPWPLVPFFHFFFWWTLNLEPPTIPFWIVACTFSDNLLYIYLFTQDSVASRLHWTPFVSADQGRATSWSRVYAKRDHGREKGRLKLLTKEENLLTCDRQLSALNISKNTKHVNVIVVSRGVIMLSLICKKKNINTKHFSSITHLQEWNIPSKGATWINFC